MKERTKRLLVSGFALGMAFVLTNVLGMHVADAKSAVRATPVNDNVRCGTNAPAVIAQAPIPTVAPVTTQSVEVSAPNNAAELDDRRQEALGMIETGNNDSEIGGAGEVSRYQIMPSVWKHYSQSSHYQNPSVSLEVAKSHWAHLYERFKQQAHREPSDFDMYVLWNTRYGYYAGKGFNPKRLSSVVRDRAQRFVNLVQRAEL